MSRRVDSRHPTMGRLWQECANSRHSPTALGADSGRARDSLRGGAIRPIATSTAAITNVHLTPIPDGYDRRVCANSGHSPPAGRGQINPERTGLDRRALPSVSSAFLGYGAPSMHTSERLQAPSTAINAIAPKAGTAAAA